MSLDKKIEKKKQELNAAVKTENIMDKHILKLSEQLDKLIVKRMRRTLA